MVEGLLALCKQNSLPEAHGIAATVQAPLSPAARAAPLSRAGVSERGRLALRAIGEARQGHGAARTNAPRGGAVVEATRRAALLT
jgi:hypothetical protein